MAIITVYQSLLVKEDGKWYREYQVDDRLPLGMDILREGPGPELKHPKYNQQTGKWEEDELSVALDAGQVTVKLKKALSIVVPKMEVTDNEALDLQPFYPKWSGEGVDYEEGLSIVNYDGLWRCQKSHKSQADWAPSVETAALWERIELDHTGALDDPIPARIPMEYYAGKIYSEDGKLYNCTRDSGKPLAYLPSALIGHYFEALN